MLQKKMFKVIAPMKKHDGGTWWLRCGTGFENKDNSINVHIDALPVGQEKITLQIRELTADELRERADRRASYNARGSGGIYNEPTSLPTISSEPALSDVPF